MIDQFRNYDAWRTRTPYDDIPEHGIGCPQYDDGDGECICPTKADLAEERAEYLRDRDADR